MVSAGPFDPWTYRTNGFSSSATLDSVAYGDGQFVAVGSYYPGSLTGLILSSSDGVTWTQRVTGLTSSFSGIRYVGEKFIATGNGGVIAVSTNGMNWAGVVLSNFTSAYLKSAAYGNGRFVAVGYQYVNGANGPVILSSTNTTNWNFWSTNTNLRLADVAYGNGRFVAVGSGTSGGTNQGVLTSTDGLEWTAQDAGLGQISGIAYGNDQFVAVDSYGGTMLTSPDGETWSAHPVNLPLAFITGLGFGNGTFLAVGSTSQSQHTLLFSTDGTNWQSEVIGPRIGNYFLYGAAFGAGTFVVVGVPHSIAQSRPVAIPSVEDLAAMPETGLAFNISGEIGRAYHLQYSTDFQSWTDLLSYTNDGAMRRFVDSSVRSNAFRVYRVVSP